MTQFAMIETDAELNTYIQSLKDKGISRLAMDFEGDQGRFRYHNSVALIQCFDGVDPVIIDVLKLEHQSLLQPLLTNPDLIKVMFAGDNDIYMAQNVLGFTITPMHDIAIAQKLLDKKINISEYIGIDKATKSKFQKANWLHRPLRADLLQYAIGDVLELFKVYDMLVAELHEKNLHDEFLERCRMLSAKNFKVNQREQYRNKFPGYLRMQQTDKKKARLIWLCRELLAEQINCSAGYMLSRKKLPSILRKGEPVEAILAALNEGRRERNYIKQSVVEQVFAKVLEIAETYPL